MSPQEQSLNHALTTLSIQGYIVPIPVRAQLLLLLEREALISRRSGIIEGMMAAQVTLSRKLESELLSAGASAEQQPGSVQG